jgi:hypothetical protein
MAQYILGFSVMAFFISWAVSSRLYKFNTLENVRKTAIVMGLTLIIVGLLTGSKLFFGAGAEAAFLYLSIRYPFPINLSSLEKIVKHEFGFGIFMLILGLAIIVF